VPWIIVRARGFQLRNSRHRGIAFSFDGRYPEAAVWYFVMPLVSAFTLGLAWPYRVHGRDRFLAKESRFGDRPFRFTAEAGQYYAVFFTAWVMAGLLLVGSCFALLVDGPTVDPEPSGPLLTVLMQVLFALGALAIFVYIRTRLLSYRWSSTQIGESDFILRLSFRRMLWLNLSNTALILLTLGLFAPFARIRVLRYSVDRFLVIQPVGEVTVAAGERQRLDAAGAEAASEFGFEIGI